jgi:hypothetical protein
MTFDGSISYGQIFAIALVLGMMLVVMIGGLVWIISILAGGGRKS